MGGAEDVPFDTRSDAQTLVPVPLPNSYCAQHVRIYIYASGLDSGWWLAFIACWALPGLYLRVVVELYCL